ncbi:MAG: aminotransferase class V-fold PLP-dependent enzyme [Terriglobia bacterium]|jgi:cysteine sulfinate desulfinase/cysteine desulfurase-like protein
MALDKTRTPLLGQEGCRGGRSKEDRYHVTYLPVDREGLLNLADLEAAITDETAVVSLMWANNETGVLFPVESIAEICQSRGVLYHCDAVQAAGKVEIDVRKIPADYLSLTGHKFHAPKGIGTLYVRRKSPFSPLVYGGHLSRCRMSASRSYLKANFAYIPHLVAPITRSCSPLNFSRPGAFEAAGHP